MALDRQKILTELGSVISQLKNADCGCMGKLFENNRQMPSPVGNNYHACGGHRPNCSECSHNMANSGYNNMQFPCMGGYNAPKLYSETYNYLNENLMKPTVKEVYDDLKSITPANTIMNSPVMNKMNLNSKWEGGQGAGAQQYKIANYNGQNPVPVNNSQMNHFSGVGPQIMNMLQGNNVNTAHQGGQMSKPLVPDVSQFPRPENDVTSAPAHFTKQYNMEQSNPTNQFMNQQNLTANAYQQNVPQAQPFTPTNANQNSYGQHTQGIAKFNEMFPGVMKNDLGFDPMSIAIQMNPANQKQAAMQSIYEIMNNNYSRKNENNAYNNNNLQQPQIESTSPLIPVQSQNSAKPVDPNLQNQFINRNMPHANQQMSMPNINSSGLGQANQQVYSSLIDLPVANQQQQMQQQPMQYQREIVDNTNINPVNPPIQSLPTVSETNEVAYDQTANIVPNREQNMDEPIYPVDTTKNIVNQNYGYNTLGQPVKMLPANAYYTPVPSLPQTLSPQPAIKFNSGASKYSNVKSTVSKTSLLANRPIGQTPSRNQLPQVYNQYKGSTSYTQQNLKDIAKSRETNSDGRLHASQINTNPPAQIPVEKIGGDNATNNPIQDQAIYKTGQVMEQIGDAPNTKPVNDTDPIINRKCRNGLQDVTFTSYPTSAAWSFHGSERAPPSAKYRYRNKF